MPTNPTGPPIATAAPVASEALTNATLPFVIALADKGWQQALADDPHFLPGLNVHQGQVTYAAVAEAFGYSLEEMEQVSLDGIEASWATEDEKSALRQRFLGEFDVLRQRFGLPPRAVG